MNRYVLILCSLLIPTVAKATIYAYSMIDSIQIQRKGQWQILYVGDIVNETDWIQTGEWGKVDLYDDKKHTFYSFQSSKPIQVKQLIDMQNANTASLPQEFWNGLRNALRGHKDDLDNIWNRYTRGGGAARGSEDWDWQVCKAILNHQPGLSDYAIEFVLLDSRSMQPVNQVTEGQQVIVEIRNKSNTALFVNIMDIMPNGEATAIFDANSFDSVLDLYIPAESVVRLSKPIEFFSPNTIDTLTLIANHLPFNLSNVLELLREPNEENLTKISKAPIGQYSTTVHILGQ